MTSWVCTEILTRDTPAARATVIEHFVQIATHCYNHNDMHCALSITVALASSSIKGLTKTWEEVDKKVSNLILKNTMRSGVQPLHVDTQMVLFVTDAVTSHYLPSSPAVPPQV